LVPAVVLLSSLKGRVDLWNNGRASYGLCLQHSAAPVAGQQRKSRKHVRLLQHFCQLLCRSNGKDQPVENSALATGKNDSP